MTTGFGAASGSGFALSPPFSFWPDLSPACFAASSFFSSFFASSGWSSSGGANGNRPSFLSATA